MYVIWSVRSEDALNFNSVQRAVAFQVAGTVSQISIVKIVQASMKSLANGKVDLVPYNQTFVDITEATANVNYITVALKYRWGSDHSLVTSDGLQLDDSSGTPGEYWIISEDAMKLLRSLQRAQILESGKQKAVCSEEVGNEGLQKAIDNKIMWSTFLHLIPRMIC